MTMEIENRLSRLFSHICKMNTIQESLGKGVGDIIVTDNSPHRISFISGSSKVGEKTYFLIDDDWNELNALCVEVSKSNQTIIAPEDVQRYLSELIWKMEGNGWSRRGILQDVKEVIQLIKQHKGEEATVTVPVWGLILKDTPLIIGDVEFSPRPFPKNVEEEVKRVDPDGRNVNAIAVTLATGDQAMIFENARAKINRAINILRAFAYPITHKYRWQEICIDGDYRLLQSFGFLDYKQHKEKTTYIKAIFGLRVGGVSPFDIKTYLPMMNILGFNEILKIINNDDKFSKSLVKAADWLGEATKPDVLQAKFVKVAFSIDAMIGGAEEDIPDKGKRARIAERAAFLLGRGYKVRKMVYDKLSEIIKKRDEIAHGSTRLVTEADVEEAGKYAKALLRRLLIGQPKFMSGQHLAAWVKKQQLLG